MAYLYPLGIYNRLYPFWHVLGTLPVCKNILEAEPEKVWASLKMGKNGPFESNSFFFNDWSAPMCRGRASRQNWNEITYLCPTRAFFRNWLSSIWCPSGILTICTVSKNSYNNPQKRRCSALGPDWYINTPFWVNKFFPENWSLTFFPIMNQHHAVFRKVI